MKWSPGSAGARDAGTVRRRFASRVRIIVGLSHHTPVSVKSVQSRPTQKRRLVRPSGKSILRLASKAAQRWWALRLVDSLSVGQPADWRDQRYMVLAYAGGNFSPRNAELNPLFQKPWRSAQDVQSYFELADIVGGTVACCGRMRSCSREMRMRPHGPPRRL